jgi:hypothetical protein
MRNPNRDEYMIKWAEDKSKFPTYAPLEELRNQTVFLKLIFREF